MNFKEHKLYGIIFDKCPRCHSHDLFVDKNPYHLKNVVKMHEKCKVCSCVFEKETWFYFGAMYISYGLNVGLVAFLFLLYYFFFWSYTVHYFVAGVTLISLILFPFIMRKSRVVWLSFFESFDASFLK